MNKIVLAILIAVIGIAVWLALKAKYEIRGLWRRLPGIWRKNQRISETALFCSALIVSLILFALLPEWLLRV